MRILDGNEKKDEKIWMKGNIEDRLMINPDRYTTASAQSFFYY